MKKKKDEPKTEKGIEEKLDICVKAAREAGHTIKAAMLCDQGKLKCKGCPWKED